MNIFYNAQHSPFGAFASFTLGFRGSRGGLGLEQGKPADEPVFVGCESAEDPNRFLALPFFDPPTSEAAEAFTSGDEEEPKMEDHFFGRIAGVTTEHFPEDAIRRRLGAATDTWQAGDLTFRVISAGEPVPDPEDPATDEAELKRLTCPAVIAELTLDNTGCDRERKAFFGFGGNDPYSAMRSFRTPRCRAIAQGRIKAIAVSADQPGTELGQAFDPEALLRPVRPGNPEHFIGPMGLITTAVPAGETATVRYAVAFFREGRATSGLETAYFYTRFFGDLGGVCDHALATADAAIAGAEALDARVDAAGLSEDRRWQLCHAVHSYYGSTQLLDDVDPRHPASLLPGRREGRSPRWVVNEGEFRMMNTFDLTADMIFFALDFHPWTQRNVMDAFIDRYAYRDEVKFPGETEADGSPRWFPGGLSFTHDHGTTNHFTPAGKSCYEFGDLRGCFSHMTAEQLTNFVCCAAVYAHATGDAAWVRRRRETFEDCLVSLENRDHHDPARRNGVIGSDSSRCGPLGAEITTYDSLDASLGQTRNNSYMAVKTWASWVVLAGLFDTLGDGERARRSRASAGRAAQTIASAELPGGTLPSILFEGHDDPIIPTIEGLVFPPRCGQAEALAEDGLYAGLIAALKRHAEAAVVPGRCVFGEGPHAGAWKLSSTTTNSWLSKIYLNQHVFHGLLGIPRGDAAAAADASHVRWLTHPEASWWAWSDQCFKGVPRGSRYYPRGVTSWLWLSEPADPPGVDRDPGGA
ncbi:glycoside hydrolase family 52 protein [Phycisphaera mikurensis]|uniref:Beta-xylosidase n=1 Tax=Phycisphaera mikurensis (strain NBRC 102666 / KCTC 22515 / FYK2301M01) TaxID=1142394 RepID=I0ICG9_PHYMF|nr:glycoside hydrolase family 52 protein [Phycisphaera mikurensis]MBB6442167.1 hypothetical protein [Phycisphaera mikurensis]BAM02957.1 beta-xylosidase [Phycisphaera mikurensis NBRC 102666]